MVKFRYKAPNSRKYFYVVGAYFRADAVVSILRKTCVLPTSVVSNLVIWRPLRFHSKTPNHKKFERLTSIGLWRVLMTYFKLVNMFAKYILFVVIFIYVYSLSCHTRIMLSQTQCCRTCFVIFISYLYLEFGSYHLTLSFPINYPRRTCPWPCRQLLITYECKLFLISLYLRSWEFKCVRSMMFLQAVLAGYFLTLRIRELMVNNHKMQSTQHYIYGAV